MLAPTHVLGHFDLFCPLRTVASALPVSAESRAHVDTWRAALAHHIEPVRVTLGYRGGLLLIALMTLLLPVAYLGLPLAVGWLVYLHAVHDTWMVGSTGGFWRLVAYLAPILAGPVVVFFLFKPFLARASSTQSQVEIDERDHPLALEFIRAIARAVGAPAPAVITVDCRVNASASLRRGLASFVGQDLRLCIGLPLVTGLTLRQLAGVLAHEMGHFAQGSGLRLTYLIRAINGWFARVVYERDTWDAKLADWSQRADIRIALVLWIARLGVWLSRRVLWVLMMGAHALGMWMLRQMEYDADRYEARLSGSDAFAATAYRVRLLSVAAANATARLSKAYLEKTLCDDFPTLVAVTAEALPKEVVERVKESSDREPGGVFDTHPPDANRIASAERENARGILRLDVPATTIFPALQSLSRRATEALYRDEHAIDLAGVALVPVERIVARDDAARRDEMACERVFGRRVSPARPMPLARLIEPKVSFEDARATLTEVLAAAARISVDTKAAEGKMMSAHGDVIRARCAAVLFEVGFLPDAIGGDIASPMAAESARARAITERDGAEADLAPGRAVLQQRLATVLSTLHASDVGDHLPEGATWAVEAAALGAALDAMAIHAPLFQRLAEEHSTLGGLLAVTPTDDDTAIRRSSHIAARARDLYRELRPALTALDEVAYPLAHARSVSVTVFILEDLPADENDLSAFVRTNHVITRIYGFHRRALGRLATIVEGVERGLGVA